MLRFSGILALGLAAALLAGLPAFCAPRLQEGRIDLSEGLSFEKYITTGSGAQLGSALERVSSTSLSEPFAGFVKGIRTPLVLVAFTDISCPDCARTIPFVHAATLANPLVRAVYFKRDDAARQFMRAQTGKASVPTIFVTDETGALVGGVYVEYPRKVQALIDASVSDDETAGHRKDLRSGLYDDEIESDLRELIEGAIANLGAR
ncbi:MAG: thioredoxin family protein [Synergistaceae bacterium]|jgi:glutaredoxin|nr:thioredoxin family protein [Synergistaceae bacterium]